MPRIENNPSDHQGQRISWHVGAVDYQGPYCFSAVGKDGVVEVIDKLRSFESMTWSEILGTQNHAISIDSLSKKAQRRLEELEMDDVDELVSLRLSGKQRVFGVRQGAVLRLLWWDPEHAVCPSLKKHT